MSSESVIRYKCDICGREHDHYPESFGSLMPDWYTVINGGNTEHLCSTDCLTVWSDREAHAKAERPA